MSVFRLGNTDPGAIPADKKQFFALYHAGLDSDLQAKLQFRDEANHDWSDFQEVNGAPISIKEFQQFLKDAGFMPKSNLDGIYGYATHAAARLFQEYLRTIEKNTQIGAPDGVVGPKTMGLIEKWKKEKTGADFVSEWGRSSAENASEEYRQWLALLDKAKAHYTANPSAILAHTEKYPKPTDTRKISEWTAGDDVIHLIGIRREQESRRLRRENDDLFILLINGMVFKFWGSTDPDRVIAERRDIPFLIEGQHDYQFSWHKMADAKKVYRALRPASHGILVFRDKDSDRGLTDVDIVKGVDAKPNTTINIHWSGIGGANFSAGCQVIAGKSYINHRNEVVDCSSFAAPTYEQLGSNKTRGAYNVLVDLLLSYAPKGVHTIKYTLGRDDTFFLSDIWDANFVKNTIEKMKNV